MTCETMLELMSAALDGELTAEEAAQLDRHLAQCEHCRALFEELTAIHDACGQMEVEPPPALRDRILEQLPPQETPVRKPSAKVIPIHWRRWAAMAAAFVLVSLAAWRLPQTGFRAERPQNSVGADKGQPQEDAAAPVEDETTIQFTSGDVDAPEAAPTPAPSAAMFNGDISLADIDETPQAKAAVPESDVDESKIALQGSSVTRFAGLTGLSDGVTTGENRTPAAAKAAGAYGSLRLFTSEPDSASFLQDVPTDEAVTADALDLPAGSETNGLLPEESVASSGSFAPMMADTGTELPEPHPELAADENVPAVLFVPSSETALPSYCGVLTLSTDAFLNDYPAQVQENGEIWYELPCAAFRALLDELTSGGASFDLRVSGDDISASAELGLVVILP